MVLKSQNIYEACTRIGMPTIAFPYKGTPKAVKEYFIKRLGKAEAKKLMNAMKQRKWIIITGPHIPTGKSVLCDILRAIGYTRVIEEWLTTTIQVSEPLMELREKKSIFEELGISLKD